MDYEGLYEAFMAGVNTALPGGGALIGAARAIDQVPEVRRFNEDVNYAKGEIGTMAGRAIEDVGEAIGDVSQNNILADYVRHLGTGLPTKAVTALRKAPPRQSIHPEAAAILKQVTGQDIPEEEPVQDVELTEDLLKQITSGKRAVTGKERLVSRPGQKGFSKSGKGYQAPQDPRVAAAQIAAASKDREGRRKAFADIVSQLAGNETITPDNLASVLQTLLSGGRIDSKKESKPK